MQKLLEKAAGSPEEALLARLALRSMKQAKYTTMHGPLWSLCKLLYALHLPDPEVPDLQIHRIIKENLHGGLTKKRICPL